MAKAEQIANKKIVVFCLFRASILKLNINIDNICVVEHFPANKQMTTEMPPTTTKTLSDGLVSLTCAYALNCFDI